MKATVDELRGGLAMTYVSLWARPELQIDLLITFGPPLAQPDIVFPNSILPRTREGVLTAGVRRWINIADPGDFIAIPAGLARYLESIDADLTAPIGVFDTHKVAGYLACTTTTAAGALATLLGR